MQLHLGHIVLVHVHQDILYHYDTELLLLPNFIDLFEEVFFSEPELFDDGLQEFDSGGFYSVVEELSMLDKDEVVGSAVEFLVGKCACLLLVDLVDGFFDSVPVLQRLIIRHDRVSHLVIAHRMLVMLRGTHLNLLNLIIL